MESIMLTSCVKIYLSSNPEDSVVERRALRESVFPRLRTHCRHKLGLDLRLIDPYESCDPSRWPDQRGRQQLIDECRESSSGPFLLALIGYQYGSGCLPVQVEVGEFQQLLQACQQAGDSTRVLEEAYQRDENIIPASYCLQPEREGRVNDKDEELRRVFYTAVSRCVLKGILTPDSCVSYYRSALDSDLRFALERCSGGTAGRCLVYVHRVLNALGQREERHDMRIHTPPQTLQPSQSATLLHGHETAPPADLLMSQLCDNFLSDLITSRQLAVYTMATECDRRHGYTSARRRTYAEHLCQQVHSDVLGLIEGFIDTETADACYDVLAGEAADQDELSHALSCLYDITRPEEQEVKSYVLKTDLHCPLVVTGGPCAGRTVLLAHCAEQMKAWLADRSPVVIPYFTNLSINLSPKRLLSSLCCQIAHSYGHPAVRSPKPDPVRPPSDPGASLGQLKEHLTYLLSHLPSRQRPAVLLLDGLDQADRGNQIVGCLPSPLPPDVKLILAVSTRSALVLDAVRLRYPQRAGPLRGSGEGEGEEAGAGWACVELVSVERRRLGGMLAALLAGSSRKITSGQQVLVNRALTSCSLPLYCHLLYEHTSLWSSASDVCEAWLPEGVHASISSLLDHLEQRHGYSLVCCALSYLTLSRTGLSEAELSDLLSCDDEVLVGYMHPDDPLPPSSMRVPEVAVERLLLDLRRFLVRRTVAGAHVLTWTSRHFALVVGRRYLVGDERRAELHSAMADFFSSRSAVGRVKPLSQQTGASVATAVLSAAAKTEMCVAGQALSQPSILDAVDPSPSAYDVGRVNTRKLLEFPHHMRESGRWAELECSFVMSLEFHQAMVRSGLLVDLVAVLEGREGWSQLPSPRARALLAWILKTCACFLCGSPLELPAVMEANLLPYLVCYPGLEGYAEEAALERGKRGGGARVLLCPAPSAVPSAQWKTATTGGSSVVAAVAGMECGEIVVGVMSDGSAWVWKRSEGEEVQELSLSHQQKQLAFVSVRTGGRCVLLSTRCHKLLLWDVTGPEIFLELEVPPRTRQSGLQFAGIAACQEKACVWWTDEGTVSVYDLCKGEPVTHIQCQSSASCLVCSSDGCRVYCGQKCGAVFIFDLNTGGLIGACSNTSQSAVKALIFCEDETEMACVDAAGNITLWDVACTTGPPNLVKECFSRSDPDPSVLGVDYSADTNNVLVCEAHRVSVWDTCAWSLCEQFLAPTRRAFSQAVLVPEGHYFLATLESSSLVLMWSFLSGECVLSLDTGTDAQLFTLFRTASDIVSVTQNGRLTLWDSELICAAGMAPKMSSAMRDIVVEPAGERFYTTDGSETVWRWCLREGTPDAHFVHGDPVVKLCLSQDGGHLVTLSGEDVYVWQAETGQNTLRIRSDGITDVLVAPNGNCAVSLSKTGLSQVWKLASGAVVCRIHLHLTGARVSPKSTFLIGCHRGDLLAASLWCGSISKRFSCADRSEHVVAFHTLPDHPDYVLVMAASGAVYTWKVAEETLCRQLQLPHTFRCNPEVFQASADGSYALVSTDNDVITLLDLPRARLCCVRAEGLVSEACLDGRGCYVAYVCWPPAVLDGGGGSVCCELHAKPVLGVTRLADGGSVGRLCLPKTPSILLWWDQLCVSVGFHDGSVGLYAFADDVVNEGGPEAGRDRLIGPEKQCFCDRALLKWLPLKTANITWT